MPHHGDEQFIPPELLEQLGATGKFPEGKIDPHDEGEIRFAIGAKDGNVFMDFGKKVIWLAFPPKLAREIADNLRKWADVAECHNHDETPHPQG